MTIRNLGHYAGVIWMITALFCCRHNDRINTETAALTGSLPVANNVTFHYDTAQHQVGVFIDGDLFTAYIYPEHISKPVLFPIRTTHGQVLTRGFPLDPKPGERIDHPHHVGLWLNYGDVNGLDFWNNSQAIPEENKHRYGTIHHQEITGMSEGEQARLDIKARWVTPAETTLLLESTSFVFGAHENTRYIERTTTLTATDNDVIFKDNKEGMVAIRVARALELPTDEPAIFTDAQGTPTEVEALNNEGVHGNYLSSEGLEGNEVWGTRAKWVMLYSHMEGEPVALAILDHPDNVGFPTYWHARGYGLFAANPLGQKVFSDGKEVLDFSLKAGASAIFKYKFLVHSGSNLTKEMLENEFDNFSKGNL